jgi:outer membrane usher protein
MTQAISQSDLGGSNGRELNWGGHIWGALVIGIIMAVLVGECHAADLPPRQPPGAASKLLPSDAKEELEPEFDLDFLRGKAFRSLDPSNFRRLGQAQPGIFDAEVYRNNALVTRTTLLLVSDASNPDAPAVACIGPALFSRLGVKASAVSIRGQALIRKLVDAGAQSQGPDQQNCLPIHQWVEGAQSELTASELRLDIQIPQAYIEPRTAQSAPKDLLVKGINAGFVNYNINSFTAGDRTSGFAGLASGLNLGGWQFRQSSSYSQVTGMPGRLIVGESVIKRPLLDLRANIALGDTQTFSPVIGSTALRGFRLSSEEALFPDEERSYRPVVRGVARSNARIRILQNNTPFFEQNVPPGPFEFSNLVPPSTVGNLTVIVTEADGSEQRFQVPFSLSIGKLNPGSYRYSLAFGRYRNFTDVQDNNVLHGYVQYGLNAHLSPILDLLYATDYRNLGLLANFTDAWGSLSMAVLGSDRQSAGLTEQGTAQRINYLTPSHRRFNLALSASRQSRDYLAPSAALSTTLDQVRPDTFKNNVTLSAGLSLASWGSVTMSLGHNTSWLQAGATQQYRLGYFTQIGAVSLVANLEQSRSSSSPLTRDGFNVSVNIPLGFSQGRARLLATTSQFGSGNKRQSLAVSGSMLQDRVNYNLNHSNTGTTSQDGASLSVQHPWGFVGGSLSTGAGLQQMGLSAGGSVVGHSRGLMLAPRVGETFAIVEVPQGEGASVQGSRASINRRGFGVVPHLSPYAMNDVQISLEGASNQLEIDNPSLSVAPVSGSIVRLRFNSTTGWPLLVTFEQADRARIPIGASIIDSAGREVGTVGQGNRGLIRVQKPQDRLRIVWGDGDSEQCFAGYLLAGQQQPNASGLTPLKVTCERAPERDAKYSILK